MDAAAASEEITTNCHTASHYYCPVDQIYKRQRNESYMSCFSTLQDRATFLKFERQITQQTNPDSSTGSFR
jgi:hypothetical protein